MQDILSHGNLPVCGSRGGGLREAVAATRGGAGGGVACGEAGSERRGRMKGNERGARSLLILKS